MNSSCNFDSSDSNIIYSDCTDLCLATSCTLDLLANDSCDPECENALCGYDKGVCGFCSPGCFASDLENSSLDPQCNTLSCLYDSSMYKECSPGCSNALLLNEECDLQCNTSLCNFDRSACLGVVSECSVGCPSFFLGNGICNEECNTEECSFDDFDCLCADECTEDLLNNEECDQKCNNESCDFDKARCACPSKCQTSTNDAFCDLDCWNEICGWADTDCGCAPNCKYEEITQCKAECLVLDCNFGDMGQRGTCEDTVKVNLAMIYQLIQQDFSAVVGIQDCEETSSQLFTETCTESMLRNDPCYTNGLLESPCNIEKCGYGLGICEDCESACGENSTCSGTSCFSCNNQKLYFTSCVDFCPDGYEAQASGLCLPQTVFNYYVSTSGNAEGTGTIESPFGSIAYALANINSKNSVIILEEDGEYHLSSVIGNTSLNDNKRPMNRDDFIPESLMIKSAGAKSHILIDSEDFMVFDMVSGTLYIENIQFNTQSLTKSCENCVFCPPDNCQYDCTPDCSIFLAYDFFTIESGATLALESVQFYNIRYNFNSLIKLNGGSLSMNQTEFYRIKTKSSVIMNECSLDNCGSITYDTGIVELLNDGYELDLNLQNKFTGFLISKKNTEIYIRNVNFEYNICHTAELIHIDNIQKLSLFENKFSKNILLNGLLTVNTPETPNYSLIKGSNNTIYETSFDNIHIKTCVFQQNYIAERGMIESSYSNYIHNTKIENTVIDNNIVKSATMISIQNTEKNIKSDGYFKIYVNNKRVLGYFYEQRVVLTNLELNDLTLDKNGAVYISSLENTYMTNVLINNFVGGSYYINDFILSDFDANTSSYLNTPQGQMLTSPDYAIYFYEISYHFLANVTYSNHNYVNIRIQDGKYLKLENSIFYNANISAYDSICSIIGISEVLIQNSTFDDLTNRHSKGSGAILLEYSQQESANIVNCTFRNNYATLGSAIILSYKELTISNCLFQYNKGTSHYGGAIAYLINGLGGSLSVSNSTFKGNSAGSGGAFSASEEVESDVGLQLELVNCSFVENSADYKGSAIHIGSSINLNQNTKIENCSFYNNTSSDGAIAIDGEGYLYIYSSEFKYNFGNNTSCIYHAGVLGFHLSLSNVSITENYGFISVLLDKDSIYNYLYTENCKFQRNFEACVVLIHGEWTDYHSIVSDNYQTNNLINSIILKKSSTAYLSYTEFTGNYAISAGAISAVEFSFFHCSNCKFTNNTGEDSSGAIYAEGACVNITDSVMSKNNCLNFNGGVLTVLTAPRCTSYISNTEITENFSYEGFELYLINCQVHMDNVTIHKNTAPGQDTGIRISLGTLKMANSKIFDQEGELTSGIASSFSDMDISNTEIFNLRIFKAGGSLNLFTVNGKIENSYFHDIYADLGSIINIINESNIVLQSNVFHDLQAPVQKIILCDKSNLSIHGLELAEFVGEGISSQQCLGLTISDSIIENGTSQAGTGLNLQETASLHLLNTTFKRLVADRGAAIDSSSNQLTFMSIVNSKFLENHSEKAGAINSLNNELEIITSHFYGNRAEAPKREVSLNSDTGIGGAIVLACNIGCEHRISGTDFQNNSATYKGGAIYWTDNEPLISDVTYFNNTATYGDDIASFPITIQEVDSDNNLIPLKRRLTSVVSELHSIASGQLVTSVLRLALVDSHGQIVSTESDGQLFLSSSSSNVSVSGNTIFFAEQGIFKVSNYTITAHFDIIAQISVSSNLIDDLEVSDEQTLQSSLTIEVHLRPCIAGEILSRDECYQCPANTYSLDPHDIECKECLDNAICYGKTQLVPLKGYWRSSNTSETIWSCPNSSACLGSPLTNISVTGNCETGYKGNKCQSCEVGYSRISLHTCAKCPDLSANIAITVIVFVLVCVFAIIMVYSSMDSAYTPKSQISVYMKIFVNYLQLVMLTIAFDLEWPGFVKELFIVQRTAGSAPSHIFSLECYFDNSSEVFFSKVVLMSSLPLLIVLLSLLFWAIYSSCGDRDKFMKEECVSTIIIFIFLVHPNIIQTMFDALNCTEIENGEYWIVSELDIRCWDTQHSFYALALALPAILVWGMAVPLLILYSLYKNKRKLHILTVRKMYGFIFNGFSHSQYYWEIVILFRKLCILACSILVANISIPMQALCLMLLLLGFIYLQYRYSPYNNIALNHIELVSLIVAGCTIYCGLFFLTKDLEEISKFVLFLLLVSVNIYFLVSWFKGLMNTEVKEYLYKIKILRKLFKMKAPQSDFQIQIEREERHVYQQGIDKVYRLVPILDSPIRFPSKFEAINKYKTIKDLYLDLILSEYNNSNKLPTIRENDEFDLYEPFEVLT